MSALSTCLHVRISPEEAMRRIRQSVARDFWGVFAVGPHPIAGVCGRDSFRLRLRTGFYGNAFAPQLRGLVRPAPEGALVDPRFVLHPYTAGFLIVGTLGLLGGTLFGWGRGLDLPVRLVHAVVGLLFFYGFAAVCRWLSSDHQETLSKFIEGLFEDVRIR